MDASFEPPQSLSAAYFHHADSPYRQPVVRHSRKLPKTLLAIVTAITFELVLGRLFLRKWPHPASAYISGISVGILLRSPAFWPYALCSALSITSKYALRVRGRHIWNPSNFGICAMLILASQAVSSLSIQWGNNFASLVVIWVLGTVISSGEHPHPSSAKQKPT